MNEEKSQLLSSSGENSDHEEQSGSYGTDREDQDRLLRTAGYGFFHILLVAVCGMATAADGTQVFAVGFVVPIAEEDLHLSTARKGYLDASVFIG